MPLLTPEDYLQFPTVPPDDSYAYGAESQQFGQLTLPQAEPPHPVIVLVHGGGYRAMYDLHPLGAMVTALANDGFAVWNIEYRRHGADGAFPRMFHDVAAATDFLRSIAAKHNLDLGRVISMGHSAGGHLALWLAGRHRIPRGSNLFANDPLPINGVIALAGLADVKGGAEGSICSDALLDVMGGTTENVPENYQSGCPRQLLPLGVPQAHIVGEQDVEMLDNIRGFVEAAQQFGDRAKLIALPNVGHFEIVAVETPAWQEVRRAVLAMRASI